MNKRTYCPKYPQNHYHFPIVFLHKQSLLLSQGYYWWIKGKKINLCSNGCRAGIHMLSNSIKMKATPKKYLSHKIIQMPIANGIKNLTTFTVPFLIP